ncbi:methylated-DNA--[protein]-cysteine S-methyltransferase [Microlunatus sp. Gsoil 973]|uniref:methylated-DNA--[protein]-cysteine S-methyltransferase n=1 Tax=Microlunatus sp. Gsoil 973 TaxID=2672569 RepID=UPI0012B4D0A0|nr:methylated-DNA--[protein]-cysteine S-methyltransferase [Microlunatus sp. Gsoil 973]QGN31623.1 methylated-DNA--[protein]-cysteine S-methyltransferase [Microlunatus sp. Gsoil 973]
MINFGATDSVAGSFGYLWTDDEAPVVLASGWTDDPDYLIALIHPSLRPGSISHGKNTTIDTAVRDYSDGDLTAIDAVSVRQRSGPFIEAAWDALRKTAPGQPATYTLLAADAGRPEAVRAAAAACARNAAALFVPCHRIVRRDGALGGFRYGLEIKRALRAHELRG